VNTTPAETRFWVYFELSVKVCLELIHYFSFSLVTLIDLFCVDGIAIALSPSFDTLQIWQIDELTDFFIVRVLHRNKRTTRPFSQFLCMMTCILFRELASFFKIYASKCCIIF